MTDPNAGEEVRALREAVQELRLANVNIAGLIRSLDSTVADLKTNTVSKVEHDALRKADLAADERVLERVGALETFKDWAVKSVLATFFLAPIAALIYTRGGM